MELKVFNVNPHLIIFQVPPSPSIIMGYILAFRRSDLDLAYSSCTLIGAHVSSHVIAMSRASQRYDVKISAFTNREYGDFSEPITWCSSGKCIYSVNLLLLTYSL
jgi:hypothetical protein